MSVAMDEGSAVHITSIKISKGGEDINQNKAVVVNDVPSVHVESQPVEQAVPVVTPVAVTEVQREEPVRSAVVEQTPEPQSTPSNNGVRSTALSAGTRESIDELLPADSLWTTRREAAVKLRIADSGPGSEKPITVPTLLKNTTKRIPNQAAIAVKRDGTWVKWTYAEYLRDVTTAAKAFIKLGLEPQMGVGIIGFNSPEWFIADLGCIFAGGLATGIYSTNSPEACQYVAESCQANVIVVENNQQLQKILKVKAALPHLKAIVQYTGEVAVREDFIYSWKDFMALGSQVSDETLNARMQSLAPNMCCLLIYTSGTTGNPKGVMLSHDNLTWVAEATQRDVQKNTQITWGDMNMVSYLPLSHIAAQMIDIYVIIAFGGTAYFAQPDALKGSLGATLREVRPHVFLGVPRVWEKMQETMKNAGRNITGIKKKMGTWAKAVGLKANYALMRKESTPWNYALADKLIFSKIRGILGMDRCVVRLSGAAPITKETLEYFMSVNLPLCEVYGMSECSGPHTNGYPKINRVSSVGKEMPGISTVLEKPDEDGNGEVVMFGRHVFMGYLGEEEKTKEVIDDAGGLHSGDIGRKDKDGFLYITGRIKELIITAGGENIPPVAIEDAVKLALPIVSNCVLIGDKRKFLSMLLTLKVDVNADTQEPSDSLTPLTVDVLKQLGSSSTTVSEILEPGDRAVLQSIQEGIDKVNKQATSNAQKVQKWSVLPKDFSIPGGELGPTMKMRRPIIQKMYLKTIEAFYEDAAGS